MHCDDVVLGCGRGVVATNVFFQLKKHKTRTNVQAIKAQDTK